jgi:nucleotide-binding universal stress UspA family protein
MSKKILVALDNSDYANKVMLQAIELAKFYKTPLLGISVVDDAYFGDLHDQLAIETKDYWTSSYQTVLDKCAKLAEESDIDYGQEMLQGNPAEQIIKYAQEKGIDLIVLGHLGKTAATGFQIGSVAQKVAAYAKCSVLVVK